MAELLIKPPFGSSRREKLQGDSIDIGRAPDNDISIIDPSVSRTHARLVRNGPEFQIIDQGSRNGVLVNDQRINAPTRITAGDRILLGDVEIELVDDTEVSGLRLGDAAFELNPASTMVLSRDEVAGDLATFVEEETTETAVRLDPGKLLTFFENVTQAVIEQRPFDDVLDEIVRHSLDIISEADRACLILLEDDEPRPRVARHRHGRQIDMEVSKTIVSRVMSSHDSVLSFNAQEDRRFSATESVFIQGICSVMCVPLVIEEQVRGVLYVDTLSPLKRFTTDELRIFAALGNIAAGHLQRQRLLTETIQRQILVEQVKAAAATQQRLQQVELPEIQGYAFRVANRPCLEVGGDYVDIIGTRERLLLVLADVCGKGIDAAILMATLKAAVYAQAETDRDVLEMTRKVNAFLVDHTAPEKFATLFVGALDPSSGVLSYVNAGHDPPVLLRAGQTTPERLDSTGLMVGAFPDPPMEAAETRLQQGDFLVVFTDGLHEAQNGDGDSFGEERLLKWIVDNRMTELDSFARRLEHEVLRFTGGLDQQDDMTQLLVRRAS